MIKKTFTFEKVGPSAAKIFKENAQFTMSDLRRATKDCVDSLVSMEMIVALFEYHKILGALPITGDAREPTYFMPIILKNATKSELKNTRRSPSVAPLMCQYTYGFMPFGVFFCTNYCFGI